jgi:hypothetical protein
MPFISLAGTGTVALVVITSRPKEMFTEIMIYVTSSKSDQLLERIGFI